MTRTLRGAGNGPAFFGSKPLHICACKASEPRRKVTHARRSGKGELLDGVVNGERVKIHVPKSDVPTERNVELRIRAALAADGFVVWKHVVEACHCCGKRPTKRTGLGEGMSDLFVLAPGTGRCAFIEVKRPGYTKSDVRPMQRERIAYLTRIGVVAGIASNEDEALALARQLRSAV